MKTIGEIINSARVAQNLSLEDIAKHTRIDIKYLDALEKNRFDLLPPPTFTKGFIRNIAKSLDKSPDDLVAIYRRDLPNLRNSSKLSSPTKGKNHDSGRWGFNQSGLILAFVGIFIFFAYLGFQYRALLIPPPLILTQPEEKAVLTSPVVIEGKTSTDSLITIDFDTDIKPSSDGSFSTTINLSPGDHELKITATNRFSKSISKTVTITVISTN